MRILAMVHAIYESARRKDGDAVITRWTELGRERLTEMLPDSLVVLPVGAVEQHGPHLPTWTDALLVTTVVERALQATSARTVLAPTVMTGASDHHLPFGGTLSLRPETLLAVLLDLARSVAECGGRRLVLVNGHGGNRGVCTDAASAAVVRYGLSTAYLNYWDMAGETPGHAGVLETSAVLALRPDLVQELPDRTAPAIPQVPNVLVQPATFWRDVNGYVEDPSRATAAQGEKWLEAAVTTLAARLSDLEHVL
ncbi:creatininase family protein [Nonomuraea sp. NPDC049784]|uniref:creatininase family protein n=1 Tax=Nonomuraea sp. NPDC049784 TaxID=3154361 RepID=UPI0033EF07C3